MAEGGVHASGRDARFVLLAGDVMQDVIVRPQGALRRGSDRAARISLVPGGSAANQSVWFGAAGVPVRLVARVGAGDVAALSRRFSLQGVRAMLAADPVRDTGMLVSLISPDGERSFFTDRGANENLGVADIPAGALSGCGLLVLSGYSFFLPGPRAVAHHLMDQARQAGVPVAIDPASSGFIRDAGVARFLNWIEGARYLFPNQQEAAVLTGEADAEAQAVRLTERFAHVVVTLGADGAIAACRGGGIGRVSARPVKVVDTTGAGDAFMAGFLSARLGGKSMKDCLEAGVELAARAVGRLGGQPPVSGYRESDEGGTGT
ncbi:MAG TPA: sugar kinase [Devosia sp.]|nr:sugar kinase [Devosia sp.]